MNTENHHKIAVMWPTEDLVALDRMRGTTPRGRFVLNMAMREFRKLREKSPTSPENVLPSNR